MSDDYSKEVSKAAEIGFKSNLLDRTLAINGAIYRTEVDDMQFFNFFAGPFGLLRVVTNLDEVTIQGAELDFRWRANENLSFFGGIGFTDGEIDRYDGRPYTNGNNLPYSPEYTGNLGGELGRRRWAIRDWSSSPASTAYSSARPGFTRCRTRLVPNLPTGIRLRPGQLQQAEARCRTS